MAEPRRKRKARGSSEAGGAPTAGGASNLNAGPAARGGAAYPVDSPGAESVPSAVDGPDPAHRPSPRERMEAGYAKAEVRNQATREGLEPLGEGQRPTVVTVGAILAALVTISILVTYAAGVKVNGEAPKLASVLAPVLILGILAWGMWGARYWAVVCFQGVLVFLIFAGVYALLVEANSVTGFAITVALLVVCGTLFWKMVKAMARIQMPGRVPPR